MKLNENAPDVTKEIEESPFYGLVPKDPLQNLAFRRCLNQLAFEDEELRRELWIACKRDELFFINTFLYVFEPRESVDYPFITWPFQDRVFVLFEKAVGRTDMGVEKSRDMGLSWMFLTTFFYRWVFRPRQTFGLVSRNEDSVDKTDDPDCLMWKLDYHYKNLPAWMRPRWNRTKMSMKNLDNSSVITGYSATQDVARGGRKTAFGMDELASWQIDSGYSAWASTQHVTNSRIVVSTPHGLAGIFADQMKNENAAMLKVSVHWTEHPEKQKGLYKFTDDQLDIIDTQYDYPSDYSFVSDGKLRSPWYDEECRRHPMEQLIAQELDIDYGGSGFPFFNAAMIDSHGAMYGMEPLAVGELDFDRESFEPSWRPQKGGSLRVWQKLTVDDEPPHVFDYVIGCDIATGTGGATNSVASVMAKETGEKVAELVTNSMFPDLFADQVIALRKWYSGPRGDAFVIWEANGPGLQFGKHFMQNSAHRVYYRTNQKVHSGRPSKVPGWHSDRDSKRQLLGDYAKYLSRGSVINRSIVALEEMLHYIYDPSGSIDHDRSKVTTDPTSAGDNHGDRVIADALAAHMVKHRTAVLQQEQKRVDPMKPPSGSMAYRFKMVEDAAKKQKESWV